MNTIILDSIMIHSIKKGLSFSEAKQLVILNFYNTGWDYKNQLKQWEQIYNKSNIQAMYK